MTVWARSTSPNATSIQTKAGELYLLPAFALLKPRGIPRQVEVDERAEPSMFSAVKRPAAMLLPTRLSSSVLKKTEAFIRAPSLRQNSSAVA
jgi:hypothetical protein